MKTFIVEVCFSGMKSYEVRAETKEDAQAVFNRLGSLDIYDNPIADHVTEDIFDIYEKHDQSVDASIDQSALAHEATTNAK